MWIFTRFGFFSVVQKPGMQDLTVRARVRADLESLRDEFLPDMGEIIEGGGTDYQFRTVIPRDVFAEALSRIAQDIDYSNFKNAVSAAQGSGRAEVYHEVWHALWKLVKDKNPEPEEMPPRNPRGQNPRQESTGSGLESTGSGLD